MHSSLSRDTALTLGKDDTHSSSPSSSSIPEPRGLLGHHRWFRCQFPPFSPVLHCPLGLGELKVCPFPDVVFPPLPVCLVFLACKRPYSFCQRCRCQVTPKHTYILNLTKSEWADYAVQVQCRKLSGKRAQTQLVMEHMATVVSAHWATVDQSWRKEWN